MLPMLTVQGAPALLYLNGHFCGETGRAALPLARTGTQYLEVRPFGMNQSGIALRLHLRAGLLSEDLPEGAYAVHWPDGRIALEIRCATPRGGSAPPVLLDAADTPDGRYLLVAEAGAATFGRYADEAVWLPVSTPTSATLRRLAQPNLMAAEGACADGRFAAVLRVGGAPQVMACASGLSATVDGQGALHCVEAVGDLVGHARARVWVPDARGEYLSGAQELVWQDGNPRWPQRAEDTARAWLEALCLGAESEAAGYLLHPQRQAALAAIAGTPDAVVDLPPDGEGGVRLGALRMAHENVAVVAPLGFVLQHSAGPQGAWRIENVEELPCAWGR